MPKITESEWKLAMEESSRAIAFCPHPDSKTVREIAAEIGKSIHRTECLLVDMVERGNAPPRCCKYDTVNGLFFNYCHDFGAKICIVCCPS